MWQIKDKDSDGNVLSGNVINLNSKDCYVNASAAKVPVGIIGLEDVVVVACEDGILISKKDKVQDVKLVAEKPKHLH